MKTIREIMRPSFLILVQTNSTPLSEAVRAMAEHNVGIVAVLDGDEAGRRPLGTRRRPPRGRIAGSTQPERRSKRS